MTLATGQTLWQILHPFQRTGVGIFELALWLNIVLTPIFRALYQRYAVTKISRLNDE